MKSGARIVSQDGTGPGEHRDRKGEMHAARKKGGRETMESENLQARSATKQGSSASLNGAAHHAEEQTPISVAREVASEIAVQSGLGAERPSAVPEEAKTEVPYAAVRDEVQNGDILCFKGKGLVSAAIRALTKSDYSHVGLLYLFEGRKYCLEAVGQGVRLMLLSELVKSYHGGIDYFEPIEVSTKQRCGAVSFGFEQLGKLYDRAGIVRFLQYIIMGEKPAAVADDFWFCSEIVCEAYRKQGVELCQMVASYTSPNDIATSARARYLYTLKPGG